jgi:hypothetical protein
MQQYLTHLEKIAIVISKIVHYSVFSPRGGGGGGVGGRGVGGQCKNKCTIPQKTKICYTWQTNKTCKWKIQGT